MDFDQRSATLSQTPNCSLFEIDDDHVLSFPHIEDSNYEATQVLLFKKVPYEASELDIIHFCRSFGVITDIFLMKNKGYAFIQFQQLKSATQCFEAIKKDGAQIKGETVFIFYTGKKEIYKQETITKHPSRFLQLLFYTNSELITTYFINKFLAPFGRANQIKIQQVNPYSIFVEMEDIGGAISIKETLHNTFYANSFKITVTYINKPQPLSQPDQGQTHFSSLQHVPNLWPSSGDFYPPGMSLGFPRSDGYLGEFKEAEEVQRRSMHSLFRWEEDLQEEEENGEKKNGSYNTVLVKNLAKGVTCNELFRLFGLYGNVMRVKIFFSNLENALVEFQESSQALIAKTHLNNCAFRNNNIFVSISKNQILGGPATESSKFYGDYRESKEHRYKIIGSKNFRNIAQPSSVLHLSNLCEHLDEGFYIRLFKNCGRVKKFLNLKGDTKNMLMEMGNIQQAVEVIIQFHNFDIEGKFLKVSFSKYQTIKG